jgi:hypothetical protein
VKELDAKITALLIQPEHLETAFDVAEQLSVVQDQLQSKFWNALEQEIRKKIGKKKFQISREGKPTEAEAQIAICEKSTDRNLLRCEFKVEQEGGRAPVFFGISWSDEVSNEKFTTLMSNSVVKPSLSKLDTLLAEAGFRRGLPWWMGWKYMDTGEGLRDRSLAITLASGNSFEERLVAELGGLIDEYLIPVQELNRALAKLKTL